jgi:FkbM family methyltransferase
MNKFIALIKSRVSKVFLLHKMSNDIFFIYSNYPKDVCIHFNNFYYSFMRLFSLPYFRPENLIVYFDISFSEKLKKFIHFKKGKNEVFYNCNFFKLKIPTFKNAESVLINDFREVFYENIYNIGFPFNDAINPKSIVFDLGGNVGAFSLYASTFCNAHKVYSFEADPRIFNSLVVNIRLNDLQKKIIPINSFVSDFVGQTQISFNELCFTMTRESKKHELGVPVPTITLDYFVKQLKIKRVDFIKMDIEGAERLAISGGRAVLAKFKPKLAISGYHRIDDVFHLIRLIKKINPEYKIIVNSKLHIYAF